MSELNLNPRNENQQGTQQEIQILLNWRYTSFTLHSTWSFFESQYTAAEYQRHKNTRRDASRHDHFLWQEHCTASAAEHHKVQLLYVKPYTYLDHKGIVQRGKVLLPQRSFL